MIIFGILVAVITVCSVSPPACKWIADHCGYNVAEFNGQKLGSLYVWLVILDIVYYGISLGTIQRGTAAGFTNFDIAVFLLNWIMIIKSLFKLMILHQKKTKNSHGVFVPTYLIRGVLIVVSVIIIITCFFCKAPFLTVMRYTILYYNLWESFLFVLENSYALEAKQIQIKQL